MVVLYPKLVNLFVSLLSKVAKTDWSVPLKFGLATANFPRILSSVNSKLVEKKLPSTSSKKLPLSWREALK